MEEEKKRSLAVLVGCNYPGTRYELHGCINDALAMRDILLSRFGFAEDDVELLTDATGSLVMPTGANIREALGRMVGRARDGDVLFFHYSGHGTLIPSTKSHHHGHRRQSGHDEAIVPCDFNLITDVDFRELVDRLPAMASFTILSDSCHSGGLIDEEKEQIGPSVVTAPTRAAAAAPDLHRPKFIPPASLLDHLSSCSNVDSTNISDHLIDVFGDKASTKFTSNPRLPKETVESDGGILLSGCQTDETSADMSPEAGLTKKAYGAFSNAVQSVLREHGDPISNRELVTRARAALRAQGFQQHPCLYCSDGNADAPFLRQQLPQATADHGNHEHGDGQERA